MKDSFAIVLCLSKFLTVSTVARKIVEWLCTVCYLSYKHCCYLKLCSGYGQWLSDLESDLISMFHQLLLFALNTCLIEVAI